MELGNESDRWVTSVQSRLSGKFCQKSLARFARDFRQTLPKSFGKTCQEKPRLRVFSSGCSIDIPWPGATPEAHKGFGLLKAGKSGVAPGHEVFLPAHFWGLPVIRNSSRRRYLVNTGGRT